MCGCRAQDKVRWCAHKLRLHRGHDADDAAEVVVDADDLGGDVNGNGDDGA